jgi:dihydroorotase/N-acyl-D-amino-acid deacylase
MRTSFIVCCLLVLLGCQAREGGPYDLIIENGRIVDGTGNPWYHGDVGIRGDKIATVGKLDGAMAKRRIDAGGKIVAPGFIDMLGQSELILLADHRAMSKISQGITTEVTGEGGSVAPLNDRILEEWKPFLDRYNIKVDWTTLDGYFRRLEANRSAINLATFVGATQVREYVIGYENRAPTPQELEAMKQLVREAMQQGALGLSTSLVYAPAAYAKTQELIELAKAAAEYGGIYISHVRDEGDKLIQSLLEAADIGRGASIPVHVWHLKVSGKQNWGTMVNVVKLFNTHREQGLDMTADLYSYPAGATSLDATMPGWAMEGGRAKLLERLKDPMAVGRIKVQLEEGAFDRQNFYRDAGPEGILLSVIDNPDLKKYEGKRLSEIAREWKKSPADALIELLIADSARSGAIYFLMSEEDVRMAMAQPWTAFNTDSPASATDGPLNIARPHPRAYGSFTRALGKYVREERLIPLEEAVRKMTSFPAQRVGLQGRGLLKPGYFADVVVFDAERVTDKATFENPHQYSEGIDVVLVNGQPVWEGGTFTGNLPGRALRGPGYRQ